MNSITVFGVSPVHSVYRSVRGPGRPTLPDALSFSDAPEKFGEVVVVHSRLGVHEHGDWLATRGRPRAPEGEYVNRFQSMPDCLGCCGESGRQAAVFPAASESPTGLYTDADRWCPRCWTYWTEFERFHLLYDQRLTRFVSGRLQHLPHDRRTATAEDVVSETVELLWRDRHKHRVPERVMYAIARRLVVRRLKPEREILSLEDSSAETTDPMDSVDDLVVLEEEFAKLPEKTRRYLYEHKGLGMTAEDVASAAGVSKSTITVSVSRGLRSLRDSFGILRMVWEFVRHVLPILSFLLGTWNWR